MTTVCTSQSLTCRPAPQSHTVCPPGLCVCFNIICYEFHEHKVLNQKREYPQANPRIRPVLWVPVPWPRHTCPVQVPDPSVTRCSRYIPHGVRPGGEPVSPLASLWGILSTPWAASPRPESVDPLTVSVAEVVRRCIRENKESASSCCPETLSPDYPGAWPVTAALWHGDGRCQRTPAVPCHRAAGRVADLPRQLRRVAGALHIQEP